MFRHTAAIGADIGRLSLKIAVVRAEGELIEVRSFPLTRKHTKTYILSRLADGIEQMRKLVAPEGINPICIGISAKGFIDHQEGTVLGPDQGIDGWSDVPLAKLLNRETGLPVFVGNDANLMTVAEHRFGVARNYKNIVFVALRTGIGGGIIINGKLYRGANNAGGEIGQMIINYEGGLSDKGIRGSFEHYASASALVRRYYEITGTAPGSKGEMLTCKEIFELSYRNDKAAVMAVAENARLVGIGLANVIMIFAPEIIVLGGGMAEARDSYLTMIRESAFASSLGNCGSDVRIERAELGQNASLLGSAYYSMIRLAGKNI